MHHGYVCLDVVPLCIVVKLFLDVAPLSTMAILCLGTAPLYTMAMLSLDVSALCMTVLEYGPSVHCGYGSLDVSTL